MEEDDDLVVSYDAENTYGDEGYVWPYKSPPRKWDHDLMGYPPGPGRPKGSGRRADLSQQVFTHLTVIERVEDHVTPSGGKHPRYRCECACGAEVFELGHNLTGGRRKSCGCRSQAMRDDWRKEDREATRAKVNAAWERRLAEHESAEAEREWQRRLAAERRRNGLL